MPIERRGMQLVEVPSSLPYGEVDYKYVPVERPLTLIQRYHLREQSRKREPKNNAIGNLDLQQVTSRRTLKMLRIKGSEGGN